MPELPEVETVCRGLSKAIQGDKIKTIETTRSGLRHPFPKNLQSAKGARINDISRRAKYILLHLSNDDIMIVHLGMSGRMTVTPKKQKYRNEKHDHFIMHMTSGTTVVLNDARRFGLVDLYPHKKLDQHRFFKHLGPEPFDKKFSAAYMSQKLAGKKPVIKIAIMDQRVVVGVGNIYAAEALYIAGISPLRPAGKVKPAEMTKLVRAIRAVLTRAIKAGGSSIKDYVQADGELGYFQHKWAVYGKGGEPCKKCKTPIRRITQGGRSTFYCPDCQK